MAGGQCTPCASQYLHLHALLLFRALLLGGPNTSCCPSTLPMQPQAVTCGSHTAACSSVEPYLLGSINLSTDGPPTGREGQRKKHVVDGQQRLVTLCLLFAAARARFLAAGEQHADFAQDLQELLVEVRGGELVEVWQICLLMCGGGRNGVKPEMRAEKGWLACRGAAFRAYFEQRHVELCNLATMRSGQCRAWQPWLPLPAYLVPCCTINRK